MKKISCIFFLVITMIFPQTNVYAESEFEAKVPEYKFMIDNEPLEDFPVLIINGDNYIPITVMANFFGFHLTTDEKQPNVIELLPGLDSNAEENSLKMVDFVKNPDRAIQQSNHDLYYHGKSTNAPLLNVGGYNFIKLEHAAVFFGVKLYVNEETNTVNISTVNDAFAFLTEEELAVYQNYLEKNVIPINIDISGKQDIFDNAGLEKYNIYLVGEHHAIARNFDLQLYFIKYLYENQGIRYIVSENGYCDAQLLNTYLHSGDISILENMMNNLKGTFGYSKEMNQFYINLYEYNKTLAADKKLEFIGIDLQHQVGTGIDYLLSLIPDVSQAPKILQNDIQTMTIAKKENSYKLDVFSSIAKNIDENKDTYEKYMSENYEHFKNGIANIVQKLECKSVDENEYMRLREKMIIENFIYQYEKINDAKCFGMFGGAHTYLNGIDKEGNANNLATYLDKNYDKTKNKISSLTVVYYNCSYMEKETGESQEIPDTTLQEMLANTTTSDYALFPLDLEGSVFAEDGSTKSQQYLILIKNSPATKMYMNKPQTLTEEYIYADK